MTVIVLVSCGAMGAALGQLLVLGGHRVLFPATGRSQATLDRAKAAGIEVLPLTFDEMWQTHGGAVELVLSILPPSEATDFALEVIGSSELEEETPLNGRIFIDLNALSLSGAECLDGIVGDAEGWTYISGSIIGMPPTFHDPAAPSINTLTHNPRIHLSSGPDDTSKLRSLYRLLGKSGWNVHILSHGSLTGVDRQMAATAAKSLKLCYSTISKRIIALATTAALTAQAVSPSLPLELVAELTESLPGVAEFIAQQMKHVVPKSGRFVDEMYSVAELMESVGQPQSVQLVLESIAQVYEHINEQATADRVKIDEQLIKFGDSLQKGLRVRRSKRKRRDTDEEENPRRGRTDSEKHVSK